MELLDYKKLRRRLESKNCHRKVRIVLFSKAGNEFVIHSNRYANNTEANHQAKELFEAQSIKGEVGEKVYGPQEVLYVCIGKEENPKKMSHNIMKAVGSLFKHLPSGTEICFSDSKYSEEAVYAFIIGSYDYNFLKKQEKEEKSIFLNEPNYSRIIEIAHSQNLARFLTDTPSNLMTPSIFIKYAQDFLEDVSDNISIEVYDEEYIISNGMNLIKGVSQGSKEKPQLLHICYKGKNSKSPDVALVGKGVTFDSGGISIKPLSNMKDMKQDMMGAAVLLSILRLAAYFGIKSYITATFPLVENMPSGSAIKPGDVLRSMSGKTVEVDNTDAEGRLILADAMTFAQRDHPEYLIDAATLTGAMVVALGSVYCGYFCNDDTMASIIDLAAKKVNELLWRLPLSNHYADSLKSSVADLVNLSGRDAGSAKAASFLEAFVEEGTKWAHFDIAGMMESFSLSEIYGKMSTGRPLTALLQVLEDIASLENKQ